VKDYVMRSMTNDANPAPFLISEADRIGFVTWTRSDDAEEKEGK